MKIEIEGDGVQVVCPYCEHPMEAEPAKGGVARLVSECGLVMEVRVVEQPHAIRMAGDHSSDAD